jgi:hypothetical protein
MVCRHGTSKPVSHMSRTITSSEWKVSSFPGFGEVFIGRQVQRLAGLRKGEVLALKWEDMRLGRDMDETPQCADARRCDAKIRRSSIAR